MENDSAALHRLIFPTGLKSSCEALCVMLDKSADKFVVAHSKCRWMMMESNLLLLLPKLLPQPLLP